MQQPQGGFYSIVAWQKADDLAVKIYKITQKFPNYELYGLTEILHISGEALLSLNLQRFLEKCTFLKPAS